MSRRELYKKAIKKWGIELQIGMFHEEIGELIKAINKLRRHPINPNLLQVEEEIADVQIMIEQMIVLFKLDETRIMTKRKDKIKRLEEMVKE